MIDNIYILTGTTLAILTVLMVAWLYWPEPQQEPPPEPPSEPIRSKPPKPKPDSNPRPAKTRTAIHADTIAALYAQADAELMLSNALDEKAKREKDPIKSATLYKRAAACMVRCNTILDNINKLESSE